MSRLVPPAIGVAPDDGGGDAPTVTTDLEPLVGTASASGLAYNGLRDLDIAADLYVTTSPSWATIASDRFQFTEPGLYWVRCDLRIDLSDSFLGAITASTSLHAPGGGYGAINTLMTRRHWNDFGGTEQHVSCQTHVAVYPEAEWNAWLLASGNYGAAVPITVVDADHTIAVNLNTSHTGTYSVGVFSSLTAFKLDPVTMPAFAP